MTRSLSLAWIAVVGLTLQLGCSQPYRPMKSLMIVGGIYHDYKALPIALADRLSRRGDMAVDVHDNILALDAKAIEPYQVLIFNDCQRPKLGEEFKQAIIRHVQSGKGLVVVHCSLWSYLDWPEWDRMIGGRVETHDKYSTYGVVVLDPTHATMCGLGNRFSITDEPYLVDKRDPNMTVLIETAEPRHDSKRNLRSGRDPQAWVKRYGQGRIFATTFGHDAASQESESFMTLLHNGIRWAGGVIDDTTHNTLTKSERQAGFKLMFNGRNLDGWQGDGSIWKVENGELVGRVKGSPNDNMLVCKKPFGDFVMRLSFRLVQGNSGVQVRSVQQPSDAPRPLEGPQIELVAGHWGSIVDYGGNDKQIIGALSATNSQAVIENGWNDLTITAVGSEIKVMINGITTAQFKQSGDASRQSGFIGLQLQRLEANEIRFRDIRARTMKTREAS